jgi:hypothetical protein
MSHDADFLPCHRALLQHLVTYNAKSWRNSQLGVKIYTLSWLSVNQMALTY